MSRVAFAAALVLAGGLDPIARGGPPEDETPTVLLHYDYMVLPDQGTSCAYGATPGRPWVSPDCSVGQACLDHVCRGHTHDPEALASGAIDMVVAAFKAQGVRLKIDKKHAAIPEKRTILFHPVDPDACAPDASQRVDLLALRAAYIGSSNPDEHYAVFGHYSGCDDTPETCSTSLQSGSCAFAFGTEVGSPQLGASGIAELPGVNFVVSLGDFINDRGGAPDPYLVGGTFMHELGHNLGLHHGGGLGPIPCTPECEDAPLFKPNYLSVMSYSYQTTGVLVGKAVGSDAFDPNDPTQRRLDYSRQVLPVGGNTPGALTEDGQLDERSGLGSGNEDLFLFDSCTSGFQIAATTGPVDWDGDGLATNPHATADLDVLDHPDQACQVHDLVLRGHDDWSRVLAHLAGGREPEGAARAPASAEPEPGLDSLARAHVLFPPRQERIRAELRREGAFRVTLYGRPDFDVSEVDTLSLRFRGATPARVDLRDSDGDGYPDLVAEFPPEARPPRVAARARLSGWLLNSQRLVGETDLSTRAERK